MKPDDFRSDSLGLPSSSGFCSLPPEMKEGILQYLPVESIANLSLVSKDWRKFIENWLCSSRACTRLVSDVGKPPVCEESKRRSLSVVSGHYCLVFRTIPSYELLGSFLITCLKNTTANDLLIAVDAVLRRIRSRQCLQTQLRYSPGLKWRHEVRLRNSIRRLFPANWCLVVAVKLLAENLCRSQTARLILVLFGPCIDGYHHWDPLYYEAEDMRPIGEFLTYCYEENVADTEEILSIIENIFKIPYSWFPPQIACLFSTLSDNLTLTLLTQNPRIDLARVLVELLEMKEKLVLSLLTNLRVIKPKHEYETLINRILKYLNWHMSIEVRLIGFGVSLDSYKALETLRCNIRLISEGKLKVIKKSK